MTQLGRKKKCRTIDLDIATLDCRCFGPMTIPVKERKTLEKILLAPDELQALMYQDIDDLTMDAGAKKMGISKTVYAGIYTRAKKKVIGCLFRRAVLFLDCPETA